MGTWKYITEEYVKFLLNKRVEWVEASNVEQMWDQAKRQWLILQKKYVAQLGREKEPKECVVEGCG